MFQRCCVGMGRCSHLFRGTHGSFYIFALCRPFSHTLRAWCRRYKYAMKDNLLSGVI
jgi:hypothetical protein